MNKETAHTNRSPEEIADTILIRRTEVPVVRCQIEHTRLCFFVDNPRLYSILRADGDDPTQEEIQEKLQDMEHVRDLIQDIRSNGGLIDPVVVRDGTWEVLEGNSRLAAYRHLAASDPVKWAYMKCIVLPGDIDESLVFALLGQYHIKGKKDWAPFEQAGFLYRRFKTHKLDLATLAREIGIGQRKAKHLIDTYQFMLDHGQTDTARWSYFDEYLKSSKIRKVRERFPDFDELIVEKIEAREIERAVDVRDRLPVVCSAPAKTVKKFAAKGLTFEEAYDQAIEAGGDCEPYKRLNKFRLWIAKTEVEVALNHTQGQTRDKVRYEIDVLGRRIKALQSKFSQ